MKLSVEIHEVRKKFGDEKAIELIKEAGFDAIDYSYYGLGADSAALSDSYREYAAYLKDILKKNNITCNQAHAPFELTRFEKTDTTEPHYTDIVRSVEAAAILGAENIIVHPVYIPVGETANGMSYEEYNLAYYKGLEPYCKKFNICISVENMFYFDEKRMYRRGMLGTPKELTEMVASINSPYFNACADLGHVAITEAEPETFILSMNPKLLKTLHIQDTDYIADRHTLPFLGGINWEAVMLSLKKIGYSGDLTYEIGGFLDNMPKELTLQALKLAASVGRHLISIFES